MKYIISEEQIKDINDCIRIREIMQIKTILKELPILEEKDEVK